MTADETGRLAAQLAAAREQLHDAQRIAALLDVETEQQPPAGVVATAWAVIERDLAARRVEAWVAVLDRLRVEARRIGLFLS